MDLRFLMCGSDIQLERKQVLSLQTGCISCIVEHLDEYSTEHLSLLPTKFRRQLLTCLPPLDILKLEGTSVVSGLDMNEVWHVIAQHYAEADDTSVLPETFKSVRWFNLVDAKTIKDDWRSIYLTRTLYIKLHTFNPSSGATKVAHTSFSQDAIQSSCWGQGMDPLYHDIFWRLIALPPRSELALYYLFENVSNFVVVKYYQKHDLIVGKLLVPKRYAGYLADSNIIELMTLLQKESHFRPKVMIFHCGFLHYNEFYQHLMSDTKSDKSRSSIYSFFADMVCEVECLEFYWPEINQREEYKKFDLGASLHTVTTILGAIFKNPSPKLTSLFVGANPTLRDCLQSIAPFFSAHHYTEASKNRVLPINMAYAGLKNVHIFALEMDCPQDISSIILHQSGLEGIELDFSSSSNSPDLLLIPIQDVISRRQFHFFISEGFWISDGSIEGTFQQFLKSNDDAEVLVSVDGHMAIIPASSSLESSSERKKFIVKRTDSLESGSVFSWLRNAGVTKLLKQVTSDAGIDINHLDAFKHYLSNCEAFRWFNSFKDDSILPDFFNQIKCPNLQIVFLGPEIYPTVLLDLLPALLGSSPQLKELYLSIHISPDTNQDRLEEMLEYLESRSRSVPFKYYLMGDFQEDHQKVLQLWVKVLVKVATLPTITYQS